MMDRLSDQLLDSDGLNSSSRIDDLARKERTRRPKIIGKEEHLGNELALSWLRLANAVGSDAGMVALFLAWLSTTRFHGSGTVGFSASEMEKKFGISRFAANRGLAALEEGGLVKAVRIKGRKSIVTFIDPRKERDRDG